MADFSPVELLELFQRAQNQFTDRVDAVWCYTPDFCPTAQNWEQLTVDGQGLSAYSAATGGPSPLPYDPSHVYRVYVQADADYRRTPRDVGQIYVRSRTSDTMIPAAQLVAMVAGGANGEPG